MSKQSKKSLKGQNLPLLSSFVLADVLLVGWLLSSQGQQFNWQTVLGGRVLTGSLFPVLCLLLGALLPASLKATLVYWRLRDVLPGCRAFTLHGPSDPRVDMVALQKKIGSLPSTAGEQNSLWYKLYKDVEADVRVVDAHKNFLLFRDLAAVSLVSIIGSPVVLAVFDVRTFLMVGAIFLVQYMLAAIAARWSGARLVTSVLALHTADVPKKRRTTKSTAV